MTGWTDIQTPTMTWLSKCDRNSRVSLVKVYPFIYIYMKLAHLTRMVMVRIDLRRGLLYNNLKFGLSVCEFPVIGFRVLQTDQR